MNQSTQDLQLRDPSFWVPGTIALEDLNHETKTVTPQPIPTSDPNDPLNWPAWRKNLNFLLASLYVFIVFIQLSIGFTAWQQYQTELGFSIAFLNAGTAGKFGSLAIGCIFLMPLVHRYGRRPLYIFGTVMQLASSVWFAITTTRGDFIGSNLLSGLGGAVGETVVQITIADVFFVHQHATMNGWYLFFTAAGACLGPVASGYVVVSQGWRWIWWWCVIFFGIYLVAILFLFEESKYVIQPPSTAQQALHHKGDTPTPQVSIREFERSGTTVQIDLSIPMKSYCERLSWITHSKTDIIRDLFQPFVLLFTFPAITSCAITYASVLACFVILTIIQATYMFGEPWNFTAAGIGLMYVAASIGSIPALLYGGYLNDKSIAWLSRRNGGIYEPEMRLWLALPVAFLASAGVMLCALGLAYHLSWPYIAFGFGLFGFGFNSAGDITLSYAMDCYQDIIGNALVGVVFIRNAMVVGVLFGLRPWIAAIGLRNMGIMMGVMSFAILLIPAVFLKYGKLFRAATSKRYKDMARLQPTTRHA